MPKKKMSPQEFHAAHSRESVEAMCLRAGTTYSYWEHIKNKRKRPSVDLARKLVTESCGRLDIDKLLFPLSELRRAGAGPLEV